MTTVLVTGGAGFIGRSLVQMLIDGGYYVIALDSFRFSNRDQIVEHPNVEWVSGDTRDRDLVFGLVERSDKIIHLAAPSSFLMHEEDDIEATSFTVVGTKTVFEAVHRLEKGKIVWASTSAVYEEHGKWPRVPFHEDLPCNPPDSKAGWKYACELEARRYSNRYGMKCIAFRPFSVYGVGEHTKVGYANVSSLFVWAMMSGHQPIVWGDGSQTRDFIYVDDVARAFVMAMENDDLPTTEINLGFGKEHTFLQVIDIIGKELGISPQPIFDEVPIQIYAQRLWASTKKAEELLGFKPEITLEEGVRKIIAATEALPRSVRDQLKLDVAQHYYERLERKEMIALS